MGEVRAEKSTSECDFSAFLRAGQAGTPPGSCQGGPLPIAVSMSE